MFSTEEYLVVTALVAIFLIGEFFRWREKQ